MVVQHRWRIRGQKHTKNTSFKRWAVLPLDAEFADSDSNGRFQKLVFSLKAKFRYVLSRGGGKHPLARWQVKWDIVMYKCIIILCIYICIHICIHILYSRYNMYIGTTYIDDRDLFGSFGGAHGLDHQLHLLNPLTSTAHRRCWVRRIIS